MLGVAARNMESAAESAINFREKKELYLKQVELLVKNHAFDEADKAIKKAQTFASNKTEKSELDAKYKNIFMQRGLELEKIQNMKKASEVYERLTYLQPENLEIKKKLAVLYNRLGKIKEAIAMEHALKNPQPIPQKQPEFDLNEFLDS
jgi:tetratricopeptide (TPR) repeat protein